jgi:hypothetical protein
MAAISLLYNTLCQPSHAHILTCGTSYYKYPSFTQVIFFTWWQSLMVNFATAVHWLPDESEQGALSWDVFIHLE